MTTKEDALWCAEMIKEKEKFGSWRTHPEQMYKQGKILSVEEIAENLIRANA